MSRFGKKFYGVLRGFRVTPAVKFLLILNFSVFILQLFAGDLSLRGNRMISFLFGLVPRLVTQNGMVWQFVTYMFLHGGFGHIFFNMFALWIFGSHLENKLGTKRFLAFYFFCGIGAGVITWAAGPFQPYPTIGASGAVIGLLTAFAFFWPNEKLYLYFVLPVKVKWIVIGYAVISFLSIPRSSEQGVAHLAHLSGIAIAFVYLLITEKYKIRINIPKRSSGFKVYQSKKSPKKNLDLDKILKKIRASGLNSLDYEELAFLKKEAQERELKNFDMFN